MSSCDACLGHECSTGCLLLPATGLQGLRLLGPTLPGGGAATVLGLGPQLRTPRAGRAGERSA
jgi:hypothetical protein